MNKNIESIGFIVDGNRRWAVENNLNKLDGHKYGFDRVVDVIKWATDLDIKQVCFYIFSTENWNRAPLEVKTLMTLFETQFAKFDQAAKDVNAKIKFVGRRSDFSAKLQKLMIEVEAKTENNTGIEVFFAASYGGRAEIIDAIKQIPTNEVDQISELTLEKYLWTANLHDPEIIIRTGGDKRLSNFLMWKSSYAELYFIETKWPDFSRNEFENILADYQTKVRLNKGK
ncbi:MAG: polyprenyl diphosphate synthase [Candidatus Saccharibacteria bacterium]|nr:polyprenyl diphosphate synthase [Candidatus Saccharibacteria bacterium]